MPTTKDVAWVADVGEFVFQFIVPFHDHVSGVV